MRKQRESGLLIPLLPPMPPSLADHANAIDRVIHHPARLVILALLGENEEIGFIEMQIVTALTPGKLSAQFVSLEKAGYVEVLKGFRGRRPFTSYRLTPAGRAAWETYWSHLNPLLDWLKNVPK